MLSPRFHISATCRIRKWSFEPDPRWHSENLPSFPHRGGASSKCRRTPEDCAPVGPILKTSTPARIAVFSLFERGKVQCNSFSPDKDPALPSVARSPVKSPRPSPEARLFPKCQDQVDLFAKYHKVQYHKLTRTQILNRSGKGF